MLKAAVFICILSLGNADFKQDCLDAHNKYRSKHVSPPLELDDEVQKYAEAHAKKLAADDKMVPSADDGYGENLLTTHGKDVNAFDIVKEWYNEIKNYNFEKEGFSSLTARFTQLVWKSTKKLGCAFAVSASGKTYTVANYSPKGNRIGEFAKNVFPALDWGNSGCIRSLNAAVILTWIIFNFM